MTAAPSTTQFAFLPHASGDMAERVRAHDWASTALGLPEQWPDALLTLVEVILAAHEPRFLAWGPERVMIYNDHYAPLCGSKHPTALGRPFAEVWADIIDDVGPIMERTYGGEAVHMEDIAFTMRDRHGYPEETHFSFSYLPVHSRDGAVDGMICTCRETTDAVLTQRLLGFQLRLGDLLRPISDATEVKHLAVQLLADELDAGLVGYGEILPSGHAVTQTSHGDGTLPTARGTPRSPGAMPTTLAALGSGSRVVLHDLAQDTGAIAREIGAMFGHTGARSVAAIPLVKHRSLVAYLFLAHATPRRWSDRELELAADVAERTWAAVERATTDTALRRTRERLAATLDAADISTWDYDVAADLLLPDDNLARLFAVAGPQARIGGSLDTFVNCAHPEDRDALRQLLRRSLTRGADWRSDHRVLQPDGSHRWVVAHGRVERDANGNAQRMPGVLVDITDRKRAEEALQDADRRKDEFLATLAHELRNPLAPIRSAARISSEPSATLQQLRWSHEVIERQVRNMALLLDDLLDVSRITRGILEVRKTPTSAASVVEAALETARPVIAARKHRLEVDLAAEAMLIDADPLRLAQALSNLLTNAAKYTDPGGTIRLAARHDGDVLELRVSDTGIGIAPASLDRIFAMFSQVEPALERSEGGLGIGLALVKGIVELHGGTVQASSAGLGRGSEFVLRIPGLHAGTPPVAQEAPSAAAGHAPLRVALADDNVDGAETLQALLELDGYEVRIAHDGLAALELVLEYRPDVVFLDIGMPGLNGYEVAQQLRGEQMPGETPPVLVALTGWGGADDKRRALNAGFDRHLTKPVDPDALVRILVETAAARKTETA
ncbi:ATP-binding protein [Xylophilus sp. GOD-11R]|uniref:ATP-binding protein n=1 Tax=Xylophilus sp. GOD-11R TaxID=3089814 RepID=UPI00298C865C|nr:ATP-binding protein [Xylophilus sp. GOD-11R]WPB57847.1 ATP-binding protein [Xylophilus sp. GOD-11R]